MGYLIFLKHFILATSFFLGNHIISHVPLYFIRHSYIRRVLRIKIGSCSSIHMGVFITGKNIQIGQHSIINRRCYLDGRGKSILIGNNVSISHQVSILTLDHIADSTSFKTSSALTQIDDYAWVGCNSIILPGVHIGYGAVVGAGSVVTKNVDRLTVVAGNPAKPIKKRECEPNYLLEYKPFYDTDILP